MSHDIAIALQRVREIFLEKPAAAHRPNSSATATWAGGLACDIVGPAGEHAVTDMPPPMGGSGQGANPGWLMRASMASCAATSIAMHAAMRGIVLRALSVKVDSDSDVRGLVGIADVPTAFQNLRMSIHLAAPGVDEAVLRDLAEGACKGSPVGATLLARNTVALSVSVSMAA